MVNAQGKRRIVPILEVINLQNSNSFFDTLSPVSFIYVALTRFSTSLLGSEADHKYRGTTQLDKPITPSNWGFQLHGENIAALIFLLRKIDGRTSQYISLQLNRPFELPREVSDEGLKLETSVFLRWNLTKISFSDANFLFHFPNDKGTVSLETKRSIHWM